MFELDDECKIIKIISDWKIIFLHGCYRGWMDGTVAANNIIYLTKIIFI